MLRTTCGTSVCRGRGLGGRRRDADVVALHEQRHDDHEDDQQHEHHVDERRDVDLGLQTGVGTACVELHDVTLPRLAPARLAISPTPRKPASSIATMACRTSRKWSFASPRITTLGSGLGARRRAEALAEMLGCDLPIVDPQPASLVDARPGSGLSRRPARSASPSSAGRPPVPFRICGAITMKMISSTSTTSTSGVTLMAACILAGSPSRMGHLGAP